jgi:hypothetical protein
MAYLIAWGIYLLMAALLMAGFERWLAGLIAERRLRIIVRSLVAIGLFTPGVVSAEQVHVVPACIAVLFNLLIHSGAGMFKAALPLFAMAALVFGVLALLEGRRQPEPEADPAEPAEE